MKWMYQFYAGVRKSSGNFPIDFFQLFSLECCRCEIPCSYPLNKPLFDVEGERRPLVAL